ncbi:hypothetical protein B0H10DRAFT_1848001, partial [Mycena sp. CBHHK59/15]
RSDMDGMLIFAGLFSASLTAFLIESYKMRTPDSGDMTVLLLSQISQQLAAAANASAFNIPPPTSFKPPATSLVCNSLWFISLGLSLACVLIATCSNNGLATFSTAQTCALLPLFVCASLCTCTTG